MRTIAYLLILLLSSIIDKAQPLDHKTIEQVTIDYMESCYVSHTVQIQSAIHLETTQKHIMDREGFSTIKNMRYSELILLTRLNGKL